MQFQESANPMTGSGQLAKSEYEGLSDLPGWRVLRSQAVVRFALTLLLLFLGTSLLVSFAPDEVTVFLHRPQSVSVAELTAHLNAKTPKSMGYVALPTLPATDLNVGNPKYVEQPTGFRYLFVGKLLLPVAADRGQKLLTVGNLEPLTDSQRVAALTEIRRVGLVDGLVNFRLDTRRSVYESSRAKVATGLFILLVAFFAFLDAARSVRNPLRGFPGSAEQRLALLREVSPLIISTPKGKKLLYESHLVFRGWFSVKAVAVPDIIWLGERRYWGMTRLDIRTTSGAVLFPIKQGTELGPFVTALKKINPTLNFGGHPRLNQLWLGNRVGLIERFREIRSQSNQTYEGIATSIGWRSNYALVDACADLEPKMASRSNFGSAVDWLRSRSNHTTSSGFSTLRNAGIASVGLLFAALQFPVQANIAAQTARPSSWPKAIQPLAEFVEKTRGAPFDHPVPVDLLSTGTYDLVAGNTKAVEENPPCGSSLGSALSSRDDVSRAAANSSLLQDALRGSRSYLCDDSRAKDWRRQAFTLLGMEPSAQSDEADHLSDSSGIYLPDERRLYVRGSELTPRLRAVIVHELTHAWQDQRFNLNRRRFRSSDAWQAWKALVEGDATFVDALYTAQEARSSDPVLAAPETSDASIVLSSYDQTTLASQVFPYTAGQIYVKRLRESGGNRALNAALQNPPVRISEVLTGVVDRQPISPIKIERAGFGTLRYQEDLDALSFFALVGQDQQLRINDHIAAYQGSVIELVESGEQTCARIIVRKPSASSWALPPSLGSAEGALERSSCLRSEELETHRTSKTQTRRISSIKSAMGRWTVAASFVELSSTKVNADTCFADKLVTTVDKRGGPSFDNTQKPRVTYEELLTFGHTCGLSEAAVKRYAGR
jgi:hypothetical protein